jgi:hypothetical protein
MSLLNTGFHWHLKVMFGLLYEIIGSNLQGMKLRKGQSMEWWRIQIGKDPSTLTQNEKKKKSTHVKAIRHKNLSQQKDLCTIFKKSNWNLYYVCLISIALSINIYFTDVGKCYLLSMFFCFKVGDSLYCLGWLWTPVFKRLSLLLHPLK